MNIFINVSIASFLFAVISLFLYYPENTRRLANILLCFFIIVGVIFLVVGIKNKGSSNTNNKPRNNTKLKIGLAIGKDSAAPLKKIPLSKIINKIDLFWDWLPAYDPKSTLYDMQKNPSIESKYLPMLWGPLNDTDIKNNLKVDSTTPAVLLWNEPDMAGTIMPSGDASGTGFWTGDPFPYGNGLKDGLSNDNDISKLNINNSSFKSIAGSLYNSIYTIKTKSKNAVIATPAMSHGAFLSDGCSGMPIQKSPGPNWSAIPSNKPNNADFYVRTLCEVENNNGYPCIGDNQNRCNGTCGCTLNGNLGPCVCNGWLQLAKYAGQIEKSENVQTWWNECKIINIHCYNRYAHLVKIHILEYIAKYFDDIQNGKEIWLTECAHVPSIKDKQEITDDALRNAKFLYDLLWDDTTSSTITKKCMGTNITLKSTSLPGLKINNPFSFVRNSDGKTISGTWSTLGLGGFTWFSSTNLYGFNTCMDSNLHDDKHAPNSSSSIFTAGETNILWTILTSENKPQQP